MKFTSTHLRPIAALLIGASAVTAQATVVTYQQGVSAYTGNVDESLISNVPGSAFPSSGNPLQVGTFGIPGGSDRVVLTRFDTSSIAGLYSGINSVSLAFTWDGNASFPTGTAVTWSLYEAAAANKDWVNTTSTWNQRNGTTDWASGFAFGGSGATPVSGTDFVATALATVSFTYDGVPANIPST